MLILGFRSSKSSSAGEGGMLKMLCLIESGRIELSSSFLKGKRSAERTSTLTCHRPSWIDQRESYRIVEGMKSY